MNRFARSLICLVLAAFIAVPVLSVRSYALENWAEDCYVASEGACLMDADSGVVLFDKNASEPYYPASITKVLTALVTIENCENLSEQLTFSYDAVHIEEENSTIIGASEGDRLSVLDCLYCLLFQSANEVANALAEHIGAKHPELKEDGMNDRAVFVKMMNMKAEALGCRGSHFNNPSGLTDENHYTTAYDMCLIMAAAIRNPVFLDIEAHTYWTHAPIRRYPRANDPWNTVYPKHSMIKRNSSQYYSGTIAGKTGYTMTAGNTLVTACRKNDMNLVVCVLNAHSNHYNDTRRLMDFGFDNFTSLKVTDYDRTDAVIASDYQISGVNMVDSVTLGIDPETRITIPKGGSFVEVRRELEAGNASAGQGPGRLTYTYGGRAVGSAELRLMNIGEMSQLYAEAEADPLLAAALGIEPETESAAGEEPAEGTSPEGAEGAEGSDEKDRTPQEDGGLKAQAGDGSAMSAGNAAAPPGSGTGGNEEKGPVSGILTPLGKYVRPVLTGLGILLGIGAAVIIGGAVMEKRDAERRAMRREERLRRTRDMTGTQQIRMDLEMQRRLRKSKKKKK